MKSSVSRIFICLLQTVVFATLTMCLISCLSPAPKSALIPSKGINPSEPAAEIESILHQNNIPVVFVQKPFSVSSGYTVIETGWVTSSNLLDLALDAAGGTITQIKYHIQVYEKEYTIKAISRILPNGQVTPAERIINTTENTQTPVQPNSLGWGMLREVHKKIDDGLSSPLPSKILS